MDREQHGNHPAVAAIGRCLRRAGSWSGVSLLSLLLVGGGVVGCSGGEVATTVVEAPPWPLAGQAEEVRSADGMVVSGHPLASRVGADVLTSGGNAVDAAVAVGFALAAVLPAAGNLGGGGFLVYRSADGDELALDYRETAPAAAGRDMYLDEDGEPTDRSITGHLASGVPGSVAGLVEMHRELGSKPWADLVEPAIELAREHVMDQVRHDSLQSAFERLDRFEGSRDVFLPDGEVPAVGAVWRQPDLAATLSRIRDQKADGFYTGMTAQLLVAEMERGGGIITLDDLAGYRPIWREPVVAEHRGYRLVSMPPPSSGGLTLTLILNILEGVSPLPELGSAELIHWETEAMRRAFTERNLHIGDPDFVEVPADRLQSQAFADELRAEIDPTRATPTDEALFVPPESTETTHYSVVDRWGNAASVTTTINGSFGSAVTVSGAGFLLNNEMDDFATAPGKPNMFGLVEGENNAVASGKRMLSSMTPTIVVDSAGEVELVVGSPGGPTIITSVYQVVRAVLDHERSLVEAVERPRLHHQALPDVLFVEPDGLDAAVRARLEDLGHEIRDRSRNSGDVSAIRRAEDGILVGVADPRRGGGAAAPRSGEAPL